MELNQENGKIYKEKQVICQIAGKIGINYFCEVRALQ
jgi:hypothetical protein